MDYEQLKINTFTEDVRIRNGTPNGQRCCVSWSGGKDSTATGILALIDGYDVMMATSLVMFTPDIPLISKRMVDFIYQTKEKFEQYGATVDIIKPISYTELCKRVITKSPFPDRNGKVYGYPNPIKCNFQQYFKEYPLRKWSRNHQCDVDFIGICFDERKRIEQLFGNKRSLLFERGYTQDDAKYICKVNDMLSPVYTSGTRDGCALCPNGKPNEIKEWLNDYPQALPILKDLDDYLAVNGKFKNEIFRGKKTLKDWGIL